MGKIISRFSLGRQGKIRNFFSGQGVSAITASGRCEPAVHTGGSPSGFDDYAGKEARRVGWFAANAPLVLESGPGKVDKGEMLISAANE
jgi:hypothetical protein